MANFDSEFFGLVFPGFQATQKIHAQNSRPEMSAFLSNFTFLNPKFIHGDFLLTGETNISGVCPTPTFELLFGYFIFSGISGLVAHAAPSQVTLGNGKHLPPPHWPSLRKWPDRPEDRHGRYGVAGPLSFSSLVLFCFPGVLLASNFLVLSGVFCSAHLPVFLRVRKARKWTLVFLETGRIRFRRARFQTPNSLSFVWPSASSKERTQ